MKKLILNTDNNYASLVLRVVLGVIVIIHGYDKLGAGFAPFMSYFTDVLKMPAVLGWLTVFIETAGCLMLIIGFATRINAVLLFGLFSGMILFVHWQDGFLMNWFGQMEKGHEGFEYHLLVLAMCSALLFLGGGAWSIDKLTAKLTQK
jgi:putative oxidoreductase